MVRIEEDLTVIVLTLNEEESLPSCLAALQWCTDVRVVDSGSTDATIDIARAAGARTYVNPPEGRFLIAEQRNWALDNCEDLREWVVFVDADEEASREYALGLARAIADSPESNCFYAAPKFLYRDHWVRHISGYPNWHARVVRRGQVRFGGGVWEDFAPPFSGGRASVPYGHRADDKGFARWLEKHLRYAEWEAMRVVGLREGEYRRSAVRRVADRLGPARKYFAVLYYMVLRRGVLDGSQGRLYMRRLFLYELLIDEWILEKRGEAHG